MIPFMQHFLYDKILELEERVNDTIQKEDKGI